jgi:hypothetical protein
MTFKSMEKQIAKLEQRFHPAPQDPHNLYSETLDQATRDGLAPNERIVEDYYQDADGGTVISRERVTSDPSDTGKNIPHGRWDREKLYARFRHTYIGGITWEKKTRVVEGTQNLKVDEQIEANESLDSILGREEECDSPTP